MQNTEETRAVVRSRAELIDAVRHAWAEVLDLDSSEQVPLEAKFLDVGGSSLLLIMLWEELQPLTPRTLKVSDLFQHSTVLAQVDLLCDDEFDGGDAREFGATGRGRLIGRAGTASAVTGATE